MPHVAFHANNLIKWNKFPVYNVSAAFGHRGLLYTSAAHTYVFQLDAETYAL